MSANVKSTAIYLHQYHELIWLSGLGGILILNRHRKYYGMFILTKRYEDLLPGEHYIIEVLRRKLRYKICVSSIKNEIEYEIIRYANRLKSRK